MANLLALALVLAVIDFGAYPSEPAFVAPAAKPVIDAKAKRFATQIREAAKQPADFNGRYRIARWGCGSNCLQWAVVNLATGRVVMASRTLTSCMPGDAATFPDWLDYRADSRLIVAYECEEPANGLLFDTRRVYAWQNGALTLLRTERLKRELVPTS